VPLLRSVLMRTFVPLVAALMRDYSSAAALNPESSRIKAPVRIKSLVFYSPVANFVIVEANYFRSLWCAANEGLEGLFQTAISPAGGRDGMEVAGAISHP